MNNIDQLVRAEGCLGGGSCKMDNDTATVGAPGLRDRRARRRRGPGEEAGGRVLGVPPRGRARAPQSRVCASGM